MMMAVGCALAPVRGHTAESESDLIRLRTREGMRVAKAKGKLRGKQPKLNPRQEAHLVALFRQGEHSTAERADLGRRAPHRAMPPPPTRRKVQGHPRVVHRWIANSE